MSKSGAVNAKIVRPVGSKRTEKPTNTEKPSTKRDEIKAKPNNNPVMATSSKKTAATTKKIASNQDGQGMIKQNQPKTVVTKKSAGPSIAATIKPKISSTTASKVSRQQPLRAVHQAPIKKPVAEKNVMNTTHNVTVASPPSLRKEQTKTQLLDDRLPRGQQNTETVPRERTKTRTLGPEEVTILKQSASDQKVTNLPDSSVTIAYVEQKPLIVQEPVAFEITFEKTITNPSINSSSEQHQDVVSDGDYEDDFDSYESDFETESSDSSQTALSSNKSEDDSKSSSRSPTESAPVYTSSKKFDDDRDFDSGTFELKGAAEKVQLDSIDERELLSEGQNDSGFGYNNATPSPIEQSNSTSSSIFTKPVTKPTTTYYKRGMELMKKINLDTMTFSLFELKPLSYDLYMKIYGHKNTNQSSTQTLGNLVDQDAQTETKAKQSMWTQYPPNFVAANDQTFSESCHQDRIGCGEGDEDVIIVRRSDECIFDNSLKIINRTNVLRDVRTTKPIDYERLNFFLQKSAITMSAICETGVTAKDLQKSDSTFSDGFFRICLNETNILDNTVVHYMYSNPMIENVVYLAHRQKSTSRTHDNSFVSVWNILDVKKPVHILSCWSLIICLEVHHNFQDLVIGGLTDGSIAVWNCNETTFCHQLNNQNTLPPTHIVSPSINSKPISFDFGCIISLKSLHSLKHRHENDEDDFKSTQICSLHEFGMLTIWTVLKTNHHSTKLESTIERKIDHRSPWSKIQLIQSGIVDLSAIDLNKRIRPKSGFEKKKMYFESNLFNDAVLRELHDFDAQKDLFDQSECFRCVDMEYHEDGIVVATNKSFLIFVATSLNKDSNRKIIVDDSNLLHATKLKSLDDILLVGLTDGSVKVIRVKSSNLCRKSCDKDSKSKPNVPFEHDNLSAKSCAIQNIIKEERRFFDDKAVKKDHRKPMENVIDDISSTRGNRFINNQILLPAMSSNREFVRWMDVSVNLNCVMSLCGERLRILSFENSVEDRVNGGGSSEIAFATIVVGFNHREYLVNLEGDSVRVHLLRKKIF